MRKKKQPKEETLAEMPPEKIVPTIESAMQDSFKFMVVIATLMSAFREEMDKEVLAEDDYKSAVLIGAMDRLFIEMDKKKFTNSQYITALMYFVMVLNQDMIKESSEYKGAFESVIDELADALELVAATEYKIQENKASHDPMYR